MTFVPDGFDVPLEHRTASFVLRPLAMEHNERDHDAWMSSIDHIKATPGFAGRSWPHPMSLEDNARDITGHAGDFAARRGFTYTVMTPDERDVIGCVYIYPVPENGSASVRSWIRASHAHLDVELYRDVGVWLESSWPFEAIEYAHRD